MINFFPELKRPKSDGMRSALGLEDLRNPFEIHLGLFGEDDSSDGAADNNPVDADAGRFSGRGNTQAAAGTPSRGTTFGVDGVSKTGSTALDAQIGYTDDDNRGNPGANFNALNNATSEQTIAAVAAAREAQDRGGSPGQVESAVGSALDNYSTGTVDRSGGLTDKGRSYIDDIVNQTFAPPSSLSTSDPDEIFDTVDLSSSTPSMALPASLPASRSGEVSRALSRTSSAILSMPNAGIGSGIPRSLIDDELKTRAEAGDRIAQAGLTPSPYELATDSRVPAVGIMTTPQATAANVLQGIDRSNPRDMAARESNMARMATADAGMITDSSPRSNQVVLGGGVDDMGSGVPLGGSYDRFTRGSDNMNLVNDARFGGPATLPTAAGTVRDLQRARGDASMLEDLRDTAPASIAAGPVLSGATTVDDDFAEMGQRGGLTQAQINAGIGYDERGLPRGLQTFTNNRGITATTNLAGTTQAQRDNMPGYMNPEKDGLQDTIFGNPLDTAYGYELNRQGDVTGVVGRPMGGGLMGAGAELLTNAIMGPPETVEDLLNRSVYTGFGEGSQIGMDDGGGDSPTKAPTDPCPAGYQMVNGACQISGDIMDLAVEDDFGSGFVINPNTGLPTLFQPTTQATQVGPINPFVLQPYPRPPVAINPPRPMQGIQALSPTGAALGRAI
mgnify:FL=1|tara:strand:- start:4736 stop:6757 length:2022 start_codon:yes stop_codon:yes gene_type:complete